MMCIKNFQLIYNLILLKMNFKSLFVLGAVLCGFASCESSLDEDNLMLSNSTQENVETKSLEGESQSFTLYASYKGMDYTVSC